MTKDYEQDIIIDEEENTEVFDLVPIEVEEEAGMSTGAAIAVGALATAGLIFIGKKVVEGGKKLWKKHQDKKAEAAATEEAEETPEVSYGEDPEQTEA